MNFYSVFTVYMFGLFTKNKEKHRISIRIFNLSMYSRGNVSDVNAN